MIDRQALRNWSTRSASGFRWTSWFPGSGWSRSAKAGRGRRPYPPASTACSCSRPGDMSWGCGGGAARRDHHPELPASVGKARPGRGSVRGDQCAPGDRAAIGGTGTIVDASIIDAPSSTKNRRRARDPEMREQWYFGTGVDAGSGHSLTTTAANASDDAAGALALTREWARRCRVACGDEAGAAPAAGRGRRRRGGQRKAPHPLYCTPRCATGAWQRTGSDRVAAGDADRRPLRRDDRGVVCPPLAGRPRRIFAYPVRRRQYRRASHASRLSPSKPRTWGCLQTFPRSVRRRSFDAGRLARGRRRGGLGPTSGRSAVPHAGTEEIRVSSDGHCAPRSKLAGQHLPRGHRPHPLDVQRQAHDSRAPSPSQAESSVRELALRVPGFARGARQHAVPTATWDLPSRPSATCASMPRSFQLQQIRLVAVARIGQYHRRLDPKRLVDLVEHPHQLTLVAGWPHLSRDDDRSPRPPSARCSTAGIPRCWSS